MLAECSSYNMRSCEFRCSEHISALKAHEAKANLREFQGFMPVFWKVTSWGLEVESIYCGSCCSQHNIQSS